MLHRYVRFVARLVLAALLACLLPSARLLAAPPALGVPAADESTPPSLTVQPVSYPPQPSLALDLALTPQPVALGETATFTVTITNRAATPADDLVVTLPTPDGALPLPGPAARTPATGWRWDIGHLDGASSTSVAGTLRLVRMPQGQALLLHPRASARDVSWQVEALGGAVVEDRAQAPATARFTPGQRAHLRSRDGRVQVDFPTHAADRALTLRAASTPLHGATPPRRGRHAAQPLFLDATDDAGTDVHQFAEPLTITLAYTPEQLQALEIQEADLIISWFDESTGSWVPLPTAVDSAAQTATAVVSHFSTFQLSDGSSPSAAFIPSLQGFQVSQFTGAASKQIDITVPAGPGNLAPTLNLSYSSSATDGPGGERPKGQAGWVGKGWSFDPAGSVAINKSLAGASWDNFSFVFSGQSFDASRGALTGVATNGRACTDAVAEASWWECWTWHAADDTFARVRADRDAGGNIQWHVWSKDGTRYDFTQPLFWRYDDGSSATRQIYKWLLTRETDPHGNALVYDYQVDTATLGGTSYNPTYYLSAIRYGFDGTTPGSGTAHYRVLLNVASRWAAPTAGVDTQWEYPESNVSTYYRDITTHEAYRLDAIQVQSLPPGASGYQLVRQYNLRYAGTTSSVQTDVSGGQKVLTLLGVQQIGSNGTSALPETSFSYGMSQGDPLTPTPGWNRLLSIDNGQGGHLSFSYEHTWLASQIPSGDNYAGLYQNYYRVTQTLTQDTSGQSYSRSVLTTYTYSTPALNDQTHAASVLYARYPSSGNGDSRTYLSHQEKKEFRGHASVVERTYDGAAIDPAKLLRSQTQWFYQGDASCTPALISLPNGSQGVNENDSCYQSMVQRESWKGRAYQSEVRSGSGSLLTQTVHSFSRNALPYFGDSSTASASNNYQRVGIWRAFNAESQVLVKTYDPSNATTPPLVQTTTYSYDVSENTNSNGGIYGNLSREELYDDAGVRQRIVMHFYAIHDTASVPASGSPYIVDHAWADYTWDGSFHTLAYTAYFYDNGTTQASIAARGLLTRQSAFYDLPSATNPTGVIHSHDTTYSYDSYGNRLTEKTYAQAGSAQLSGGVWDFDPAGNNSAARTTTTTYHSVFHALPIQQSNALSQLTRADYDERMGTLIRVTGPNTTGTTTDCSLASYSIPDTEESTCAQYDVFGRLVKLVKAGDSTSFPTVQASYYDSDQPFRYRIDRRETAGSANARVEQQFYDGLGRKIQVKAESANGTQNIVLDTRYDGLNRVTASSQPRYVNESASSFVDYSDPGIGALYRETSTSYDALGRTLDVQGPDAAIPPARTRYTLGSLGLIAATTDSNGHKVERESDEFGRLRTVREYTGTSSYGLYATSSYAYNSLDQLVRVTDAAGNVTTMQYDSLGRKSNLLNPSLPAMSDPDMGDWNYTYDANGNLLTQTDAKGQVLWFGYDTLDRLFQKRQSSSTGTVLAQYSYDAGTNGKGHRTGMSAVSGASSSWVYDARGRQTQATHTVAGLSGARVFRRSYDSGDRLSSITYPIVGTSTETVTMSYDAAWRPVSACTNLGGCYVQGAVYTALDQPDHWQLGNSLIQNWNYSSPLQRLSQLQVGTSSSAGSIFDRSYTYDNVGNVDTLVDNKILQTQNFDYDHLDRLTHAWTTGSATAAYDETYNYSTLGNLTNKDGVGYTYPASGATSTRPHTPSSVGGTSYVYDANGNLTSGAGRTYTWTLDNLPASVSQTSGSESYSYDADSERVKVVRGSTTTVYLEGLWEEVVGGVAKSYYTFNGQTVAVRDRSTNVITYLHGDHLGSVSVATTSGGALTSQQEYTPFGSHRGSGDITQTSLDYTGQRLDGTGLLYYHARMYDPALGRFVSPDSFVPGAGALTIGPGGSVGNGLSDPQNLNRYTYVTNNPVKYTDLSGHSQSCGPPECTGESMEMGCTGACGGGGGEFGEGGSTSVGGEPMPAGGITGEGSVSGGEWGGSSGEAMADPVAPTADYGANDTTGEYHLPADVPNSYSVVRGGTRDMPEQGTTFSGSYGSTIEDAASGVPHGTIRSTTAGDIRAGGGSVEVAPEAAYEGGPINYRHVNVQEGPKGGGFSEPYPNPIPKSDRIPSRPTNY